MSYSWAERVFALRPDADDLHNGAVRRKAARVALGSYTAIAFYGHGNILALLGQGGIPAITMLDALTARFRGKIVFAIACDSGREFVGMGWMAAARGARAYFGYTRQLRVFEDASAMFGQVANASLLNMIVRGATAGEAFDYARSAYYDAIAYYAEDVVGKRHPTAPGIVFHLSWDLRSLALWGDRRIRLT